MPSNRVLGCLLQQRVRVLAARCCTAWSGLPVAARSVFAAWEVVIEKIIALSVNGQVTMVFEPKGQKTIGAKLKSFELAVEHLRRTTAISSSTNTLLPPGGN